MASAWKSASAAEAKVSRLPQHGHAAWTLALAALCVLATPAAALDLSEMEGHVTIGYAKVFADQAPGGSLSFSGGLDLPVAEHWRAGLGIGVSLLGTRNEVRGSLSATIDYSTFEALAYAHWLAPGLGPVERVSVGAGIMTARAEISSAGGGAAFLDLARDEIVPAMALEATLMPRGPSPVRAGLEIGARFGFLSNVDVAVPVNGEAVAAEVWTVASVRLAIYY